MHSLASNHADTTVRRGAIESCSMKTTESAVDEDDERRTLPDRRLSSRKRVLRGGKAFWPNGDSAACMVYNVSMAGAKLEVFGPVPNSFDLVVDGDSVRRPCSVIWRKANRIGVRFQVAVELAPLAGNQIRSTGGFRRYVETCEALAGRASSSDRQILLEMAAAWKKAIRLLRVRER